MVRILIAIGASVDALDADGRTPIDLSAMTSEDRVVVILLQQYEAMLRRAALLRSSGLGCPGLLSK